MIQFLRSASITVMFITNEWVLSAITKTPNVVKSSLKDIELFSRNAHNQIVNSVHDGIDTAIERIRYDLESKMTNDFVMIILSTEILKTLQYRCGQAARRTNTEKYRKRFWHSNIVGIDSRNLLRCN